MSDAPISLAEGRSPSQPPYPADIPTWNGDPSREAFDRALMEGRIVGGISSDGFGHITYQTAESIAQWVKLTMGPR